MFRFTFLPFEEPGSKVTALFTGMSALEYNDNPAGLIAVPVDNICPAIISPGNLQYLGAAI